MKKIISILLLLSLMLAAPSVVTLAQETVPEFDPSVKSSNVVNTKEKGDPGIGIDASKPTDDLIFRWGGGIRDCGTLKVEFHAFTECYKDCTKGRLVMFVQRWNGSIWETVASKSFTGYNTDYFFYHSVANVPYAGYYRLKVTHYAEAGDYYEYQFTTTNHIYVD